MGEYDVIVCGGGPSGCAAAVASARCGAKTLLLEKNGFLGGAPVTQLVDAVLSTNGADFMGIWHEYAALLTRYDGFTGIHQSRNTLYPDFTWQRGSVDPEQVKRVWQEMAVAAGVEILYYGTVIGVFCEDGRIAGIELFCRGMRHAFIGKRIIDATGNADVAALSGCRWLRGSEPEHYTQEVSLIYRSCGTLERHNVGKRMEVISRKDRKRVDTLDIRDLSAATVEMREEIWQSQPTEKLIATAYELGVRTSRIVTGCETVSNDAAWNLEKNSAGIARCSWELDIHPTGTGPVDPHLYHSRSRIYTERLQRIAAGEWFDIPYGALVAAGIDNLLLAGRIVSAELFAHGSLRIQQTCMATGESAGIAAAFSIEKKTTPSNLNSLETAEYITMVRQK